jgi:hypothetical protein
MVATDLERIFSALEASGTRYLVVGGVAVVLHGHPRFTADLDLVISLDRANLSRGLRALLGLWSPDVPATEVDVFASEPFAFEAAYARALHADLGTTTVPVASLADLIELKRRAGRAQDLEDVRALEAISRELEGGGHG